MIRTIALIFRNEFRLLTRDTAALFMLFLAPIVIIAVAGFSLGNMYGADVRGRVYVIPIVDNDHGKIAHAIIAALAKDPSLEVATVSDLAQARAIVMKRNRAPLAIEIPAGTTKAFESGSTAQISVYVDPIKRLEASAIELRLGDLSRKISEAARNRARDDFARKSADLRSRLEKLTAQANEIQAHIARFRRESEDARARIAATIESRMREQIQSVEAQARDAAASAQAQINAGLDAHRDAIAAVARYLSELQAVEPEFNKWLADLKSAAGSHASEIPPPPKWPAPPDQKLLAEVTHPPRISIAAPAIHPAPSLGDLKIDIPAMTPPPAADFALNVRDLLPAATAPIPGDIAWSDRSLTANRTAVNSFDQYVPGFGITFLLLDMLWGVSVGLVDEREWGTLERLRVSGARVSALMVGKLLARFLIGLFQMVVLFGVGWLMFGITLGRSPAMLLLPAAAIAFAGAAFGLVIACVARTRDSVLPIGSVAAMAMSAIGGCWWPIGFEPEWMRTAALAMPTTWTMRAFNDLMIRGLDPSHAIIPAAVTATIGIVFLAAGVFGSSQLYD